jgi:5-methylcytosine-specific restriction protein A
LPNKAKRPCNQVGCNELTNDRYCQQHKKNYDKQRGSAAQRGYGSNWRQARKYYLMNHPVCVRCERVANVVDHIVPHRGDNRLFWDRSNWQPLCDSCHSSKTVKEDGGFGR